MAWEAWEAFELKDPLLELVEVRFRELVGV